MPNERFRSSTKGQERVWEREREREKRGKKERSVVSSC